MILVDTSVWITHFREGVSHLEELLMNTSVVIHPYIIGELACGNLKNRNEILSLLKNLPHVKMAENSEILKFIEEKQIMGLGIGLIDVHLLVSTLLSNVLFWTYDKKLANFASKLKINYK